LTNARTLCGHHLPNSQDVGCGKGEGATAGVGVTAGGLGDGVTSVGVNIGTVGVAVGGARGSGLGTMARIVPQIMLTATSALNIRNRFPPGRPLAERFTSYLPNLLFFATPESLQCGLRAGVYGQGLL
jgi:hypothetical protein